MRILVHDYSGHPFQMQLSRALAADHEVMHVHCASYQTGKGAVTRRDGDPAGLSIEAIDLGRTFDRYSWTRRLGQELAYGIRFSRRAASFRPDVILSSNDPLFAKSVAAAWCRISSTPWVFWLQDIYSLAMSTHAKQRLGGAGRPLGAGFRALERRLLRDAAAVVAITDDFRSPLRRWGIASDKCHVIENWAPLPELDALPKDNPWSRSHGLHDRRVLLYSGTLGLKHHPGLLLALAERFRSDPDVRVVVVSQGRGIDWLQQEQAARRRDNRPLDNLVLLPYQPYELLAQVFASADILLVILQDDAGVFSVPSKVLSNLCARRPILAAMPGANLGARTIERAGAGIVVAANDERGWLAAADKLLGDPDLRRRHGDMGRRYAEATFDIGTITDRFEQILTTAARG
ncbi:MAG: glycosyltransferase family 4 protein [Actinomycetota bacterium]|nr:glycosyltransferase family 4 protein [Actinomycetota bacterium]